MTKAKTEEKGAAAAAAPARSMIRIGRDHHRAVRMAAASSGVGVSEMLEMVVEGDNEAVDLVAGFFAEGRE